MTDEHKCRYCFVIYEFQRDKILCETRHLEQMQKEINAEIVKTNNELKITKLTDF